MNMTSYEEPARGGRLRPDAVAVGEATEGATGVSTADIVLSASGADCDCAAVHDNTCCGLKLAAPDTVGPFVKFWRLERHDAPTRAPGGIGYASFQYYPTADARNSAAVAKALVADGSGYSSSASPHAHTPPRVGSSRSNRSSHAGDSDSEDDEQLLRVWVGTILVVTKASLNDVEVELLDDHGVRQHSLRGEQVETFGPWRALRFWVKLVLHEEHTKVHYGVTVGGRELKMSDGSGFCFHMAGSAHPTHWGYYSCSGFSLDVSAQDREGKWGGMKPLWQDVWNVHTANPLHLLVGGGDQLYNDDVWQLAVLKRFLALPRDTAEQRQAKAALPLDKEMAAAVEAYYFHHYAVHFSQPVLSDVYAAVPQVMTWDDHDIFDGWGSYPDHLQRSKVFQGIFALARRWYCVFQQHCKPDEKAPVAVYELGGRTAIVACDQREKRRTDQVLPLEHYMKFSLLCTQLPKGIRHVVFVSTVPVVYPHIRGARSVLRMSSNNVVAGLLAKIGKSPMNIFGEPELMDDIDDHWSAESHTEERRFLIEHLQMLAKYRGCRVTLLSGDVHVAGTGQLASTPRPLDEAGLRHDFRYMPQVISSAIANPPPPTGLLKVLEAFSASGKINRHTRHSMTRVIKTRVGVGKPLENKRNWCEVIEEKEVNPDDRAALNGSLTFRLRIEDSPGATAPVRQFDLVVPPLEKIPATGDYFDVNSVPLVHRGLLRCCFGACAAAD